MLTCGLFHRLCTTRLCVAHLEKSLHNTEWYRKDLARRPCPQQEARAPIGGESNDSASTRLLDQLLLGRQSAAEQMGSSLATQDLGLLARYQRIACRERSAEETAIIIKQLCSRRLPGTLQLVLSNTTVGVDDGNRLLKV